MKERLQKILAQAGVASRRKAEQLIVTGCVKVNKKIVKTLGQKADPEKDLIEVDGKRIKNQADKAYFLFYKPPGYLTTLKDPFNRPTISHFFKNIKKRVYPVGRLDMDSEGLLILTNDGELSARLMHPRYHVPKTYRVKVKGQLSEAAQEQLAGGTLVLGDRPVNPAEVKIIKRGQDRTWMQITLTEGRHRQIKRMCSQVGHPVLKLKRTSYGPLVLGRLARGTIKPLQGDEIRALKEAAGLVTTSKRKPRSKVSRSKSRKTRSNTRPKNPPA
ncbi:MAG: rRNA pseudouridine synthase [Deltaproteobacteria bacterium]|nr:rRNA pseudouridine synthase [Deltaproteobacteria bacterium]MBW2139883.1 rRNA pseudouridine synthase [Deltaproteobacteria bacterium]